MFFKFFVKLFGVANVFIKFGPELLAMVFDVDMDQLVQHYIVHKFIGQSCQVDVQVDVVYFRATSPSGFLVSYKQPVVGESMFVCQVIEPLCDLGPCFGFIKSGGAVYCGYMLLFNFFDMVEALFCPSDI